MSVLSVKSIKKQKKKNEGKTSGSKMTSELLVPASSHAAAPLAGGQEGAGHQEVTTWT